MPHRPRSVGQVLEIPGYGGGAGMPSSVPTRGSWLNRSIEEGVTQALGAPRRVVSAGISRMLSRQSGCCPCPPGQQGRRPPYDQTPYDEPGLGQPSGPQKPFQRRGQDPCDEVFKRLGLDPNDPCLRKVMRQAAPRRRQRYTAAQRMYGEDAVPSTVRRRRRKPAAGGSARKRLADPPKRKAVRRSLAPRTKRGRYELLQNGACYDPVAHKFVKRVLCR